MEEALIAGRAARRLLVVPHRREALERIVLHATQLRIPIAEVEGGTLTALAGFDGHQGIAVVVEERRFATLEELLARAIERREPPFILVLDSLEDPQNLGSLLRSAEAAGAHGVVFPIRRQAPLTPAAVKASAGAVEHLLLVPVEDLAGALADLHVRGVRVVGAEADAALTQREADMRGPLALVVGHEGQGLGPAVRRRCDLLVRIPMRGRIASLNAAVAGSILLFEASGQRGEVPSPPAPRERVDEAEVADEAVADEVAAASTGPGRGADDAPAPSPKRTRKAKAAAPAEPAPAGPAPTDAAPAPPTAAASDEPAGADAAPAAPAPAEVAAAASGPGADLARVPGPDDDLLPGGPPVATSAARKRAKAAAPGKGPATVDSPAPDAPAPRAKRGRKAASAASDVPDAKPKRGRKGAAEPAPEPKRSKK